MQAIVSRNTSSGYLMVPMFTPLLRCLKRCTTSIMIGSLQEGKVFENRLKTLFESKLSKEKFHLVSAEDTSEELMAEIDLLAAEGIAYCGQLLSATESIIRNVAAGAFASLLRAVVSSPASCGRPSNSGKDKTDLCARDTLVVTLKSVFDQLFAKKNSRVPVKVFHDIADRFPNYVCEQLLSAVVTACSEAKSSYLRGEACKLINSFIKKYKVLSASNQQQVVAAVSNVAFSVSTTLMSSSGESVDNKTKRIRPVMELSRDMLKLIIAQIKSVDVSRSHPVQIEQKSVDALKQLTTLDSAFLASSKSTVVKRLAEQISSLLGEIPLDIIQYESQENNSKNAKATSGKKGKRKLSDLEEVASSTKKSIKQAKKK